MLKTASKNIVPSPSYDFFENRDLPVNENLKSRYRKTAFIKYLLEKTTHPKVLKLGLYLPWVTIYRFGLGI